MAAAAKERQPAAIAKIPVAEFAASPWPFQPGNYQVLNPQAPVALLAVGDTFLSPAELPACVAISGILTTENIGVEYLVKNLISNPFIRHLAVIGREIPGHRPTDAILNLAANGVDGARRIIGARGARPVLANLLAAEVDHFRRQIQIHNLLDCTDTDLLRKKIASLAFLPHPPVDAGLRVEMVAAIEARPAKRLHLDPEGYFIILVNRGGKNQLRVEHYKNNGSLAHIIEGKDPAALCSTLLAMGLVSRLDHAAYLGRELARAEAALRMGTAYIQDRAVGEISCELPLRR